MMSSAISFTDCPICNEKFVPPIYQCSNGHVMCNVCIQQMSRCGECRLPLTEPRIRNRVLEHLCSSLPVKCPAESEGCKEEGTVAEIQSHYKTCKHRAQSNKQVLGLEPTDIMWKTRSNGDSAEFAIQGGIDSGRTIYVARTKRSGGVFPGGLRNGDAFITAGYGLRSFESTEYEVLVAPVDSLSWVDCSGNKIPWYAVPGGRDPSGDTYYIGRVAHKDALLVGKVHPCYATCYIPEGGKDFKVELNTSTTTMKFLFIGIPWVGNRGL